MRLLGTMNEEERLEFEQASGIRTEGALRIVEEAEHRASEMLQTAIREIQEVIGPHGSVTRVQAGGVRVSRSGIGVYEDGILKTVMESDGDFHVGSDTALPGTTSFSVFVNEQTYNNEAMGAGDMLIGDNTSTESNVKFDASEGQLQFRLGTTVNAYMDTDGVLKAGGGNIQLSNSGIVIIEGDSGQGFISFYDTTGAIQKFSIKVAGDGMQTQSLLVGGEIAWSIILSDATSPDVIWKEHPSETNTAHFEINAGISATLVHIANDIILSANRDGTETVFNELSNDIDFRIEGATVPNVFKVDAGEDRVQFGADHYIPTRNSSNPNVIFNEANQDMDFTVEGATDANLFKADASTDRVGIGTAAPATKLDVVGSATISSDIVLGGNIGMGGAITLDGSINMTAGSFYKLGGRDIMAGWIPQTATWTRTGDHTFTVPGNLTQEFRKGTKIKYRDGGSDEYGVVASSTFSDPTTTVNLIPNTDYAMAAATITDRYISYIENPSGFPDWFTWSPTYSASGSLTYTSVTSEIARWRVSGRSLHWSLRSSGTLGGTASSAILVTLPVDSSLAFGPAGGYGVTATVAAKINVAIAGSPNQLNVQKYDGSNYATSGTMVMVIAGFYEF